MTSENMPIQIRNLVPTAKKVFAVGSGKGGVGKSSVAVNLAIALQKLGKTVGLLDADIYGPSCPQLLSTANTEIRLIGENRLVPIECFGLKTISIGNLVPRDRATIWRGPMVHQALTQLLGGVEWGKLDCLILDLPPGTGDVHLTMMQSVKVDSAIVVSTPQEVALADVRKFIDMCYQLNIPIAGVIENMAYFECTHGMRYHLFGQGGAKRMSETLTIPFLGEIPLLEAITQSGEDGTPYAIEDQGGIFETIAKRIG